MLTGGRYVDVRPRRAPRTLRLLAFTVIVLGARLGFGQSSAKEDPHPVIPLPHKGARSVPARKSTDYDRLLAACKETHIAPPLAHRSRGSRAREGARPDSRTAALVPMPSRPANRRGGRPIALWWGTVGAGEFNRLLNACRTTHIPPPRPGSGLTGKELCLRRSPASDLKLNLAALVAAFHETKIAPPVPRMVPGLEDLAPLLVACMKADVPPPVQISPRRDLAGPLRQAGQEAESATLVRR